jgi:GAF domain-containing protein
MALSPVTPRPRQLDPHSRTQGPGDETAASAVVPLLSDYLDDVAVRTAGRLGRVAGVAVTLSVEGEPWTVGSSNVLAAEVDQIQYEVGLGPCLLALRDGVTTYAADLARDDRWGDYGPRAAAHGAASCISVPVLLGESPAAVVKVYSGEVDGLSAAQRDLALAVAPEVAGGVRLALTLGEQAQALDDRATAMNTRRVIDLALGILMERGQCSAAEAFDSLRTTSQHRNVKLREAAQQVLASVPGAGSSDVRAPFRARPEGATPAAMRPRPGPQDSGSRPSGHKRR